VTFEQDAATAGTELHAGDVVNIPADVKHWHGAARIVGLYTLPLRLIPKKVRQRGWNQYRRSYNKLE